MAIGSNPCGCPEGIGTCAEAWECIQTHLCTGQGLTAAGGCLGVALGSCLGFDGQGRIAYICGEAPEPGPCAVTVDTLLADGFFVGGKEGGASARAAWASPQAIDYALANAVPFIECHAFMLNDGVMAWSGMARGQDLSIWTASGTTGAADRSSTEWISMTSDPGTLVNPTGRSKQAPAASLTPDGGYFGYYLPQFSAMLANDALRRVGGHAVVNLDTSSGGTGNLTRTNDVETAIRVVGETCTQASVMVTVNTAAMTSHSAMLAGAGITACVNLYGDTTTTPAAVAATDATWVRMEDTQTDARITSFITAGLNVLLVTNSRHIETERAQALGVAGIVCIDPVYARDQFRQLGFWNGAAKGTAIGVLDYFTDQKNQVQQLAAMGYARQETLGLWVHNSADVNATFPDTGASLLNFKTLGMLTFTDDTVPTWTCDLDMRFDFTSRPTSTGCYGGLVICAVNDADMTGNVGLYGPKYTALRSGYLLVHIIGSNTGGGQLRIYRFDGSGIPLLASSAALVTPVSGSLRNYDITVTATGITFATTGATVSVTDATYRGRYMYMATANSRNTPGTFQCGVSVNPNIV
jgi:hypothetical protein